MKNIVVCLETIKEYDEYMKMCEEAGWKWSTGKKPTEFNKFHECEDICVTIQKDLMYSDREIFEDDCYGVLSFNELIETMKIKDRLNTPKGG